MKDISDEIYREYKLKDGSTLRIDKPLTMSLSNSRTHYIEAEDDMLYMVPDEGFNAIIIKGKSGKFEWVGAQNGVDKKSK